MRSFRSFVCSQGTRPNEGHGRFPMLEVGLFGGNRVSEINLPALHIDRARAASLLESSVQLFGWTSVPSNRVSQQPISQPLKVFNKIVFARLLIRGNLSGSGV